jgi:hypothetical protein
VKGKDLGVVRSEAGPGPALGAVDLIGAPGCIGSFREMEGWKHRLKFRGGEGDL